MWLEFDPQAGHEQSGRRPALVLSPAIYNRRSGLALCCPLTTRVKGHPFEVAVAGASPGVVLADQVKCLDWRARKATLKARASAAELSEVREKLKALIG